MKKFSNLQQLWSYCLYCPQCKDITRDISISSGGIWKTMSFKKKDTLLTIKCKAVANEKEYFSTYEIDMLSNTFVFISSTPDALKQHYSVQPAVDFDYNSLIIAIEGACKRCLNTMVHADSVMLEFSDKTVNYFSIATENIQFKSGKRTFILQLDHSDEHLELLDPEDFSVALQLPLDQFNFSDPQKLISRVKTFLTFS